MSQHIYTDKFAPDHMLFTAEEEVYRRQWCLNGIWKFAPISVPKGYRHNQGVPPELPLPEDTDFSDTPIFIPSPWNGNIWGSGRVDRNQPEQRYYPDSLYYPSYPVEWDTAQQGWLRRTVRLPSGQKGRRLFLHFESIMGAAQIWINRQLAGRHFDSFLPFDVDVTGYMREGDNELLVGVQQMHLFDKQSEKYKNMRTPYAHGSNTQDLAGIWQDVYLISLPPVYIKDVYVRPLVEQGQLEYDVTIVNTTDQPRVAIVDGAVYPFFCTPDSPVPDGHIGASVLHLPPQKLLLVPGGSLTITGKAIVNGELKLWSPDSPHLHMALLTLNSENNVRDMRAIRFGWRQWQMDDRHICLNGKVIELIGDICHPFGPFMFSRRFVQSWYRLIKSVGGNAVRLHAQPYPQMFLDVADEMGICVLDETALFGSCLTLNLEEEVAWQRYREHIEGLVLRDRNRASVFGWSFGNELFAIFLYDDVAKQDEMKFYARLYALGNRIHAMDSTRDFITCDGDEDLIGTLPVWSKHYGHGVRTLPVVDKPVVVGESGGTYYATPNQLSAFNGEKAFESYAGRNQALGIDLYNTFRAFEGKTAYISPSELMWFGLEPLPFGYDDFSRLPTFQDGIFFSYAKEEEPGMYMERLPPYVGNLNPGFDAQLPEYRALDMIRAMREATKRDDAYNKNWQLISPVLPQPPVYRKREGIVFAGSKSSDIYNVLLAAGLLPVENSRFLVVDLETCPDIAWEKVNAVTADGGWAFLHAATGSGASRVENWLAEPLKLTQRKATMLIRAAEHPFVASIPLQDMYFAENTEDKYILFHGMNGRLIQKGEVLLEAANVDWALFNNQPENRKCGAVMMYEQLHKEEGAALVCIPWKKGEILLSTIRAVPASLPHCRFFRHLFENMGTTAIAGGDISLEKDKNTEQVHDLLLNGPVEA